MRAEIEPKEIAKYFAPLLKKLGINKRKANLELVKKITLQDLNWSGGTRYSYSAFTVDGMETGNANRYHALAPWNNVAEGATVDIPDGHLVIRHGYFCGKETTPTIYVNADYAEDNMLLENIEGGGN